MKTTTNLQQLLLSQEISNHLLAYTFFQRSPSLANQYIIELTVHSIFFPDSFIQAPDSLKRTNLPIKELTILEKNNTRISKNNLICFFNELDKYENILLDYPSFRKALGNLFNALTFFPDPVFETQTSRLFEKLSAHELAPTSLVDFGIYLYEISQKSRAEDLWNRIPMQLFQFEFFKRIISCLIKDGKDTVLLIKFIHMSAEHFPFNDELSLLACQFLYDNERYQDLLDLVDRLYAGFENHATIQRFRIYELAANSAYFEKQDLTQFEWYATRAFDIGNQLSSISRTAIQLYQKDGQIKKVIDWLKRESSREPTNYFLLKEIAENYLKLNDKAKAILYYEKMLTINPNLYSIQEAIHGLNAL